MSTNAERRPQPPARSRRRAAGDDGAVAVEFALTLPLFVMLLVGTITAGFTLYHRMELVSAAREAARYGATVPLDQCPTSCGGVTWAQLIRSRAVSEGNGDLASADVCVALVSGPGSAPVAVSSSHTTAGGTSPCFVDNLTDDGLRVQVTVQRVDKMEWLVSSRTMTQRVTATARYEQ